MFGKYISKNERLNRIVKEVFSEFKFIKEDEKIMKQVLTSDFPDLEDALQYFTAASLPADLIITRNVHDYFPSKIPVLLPSEFIQFYYTS